MKTYGSAKHVLDIHRDNIPLISTLAAEYGVDETEMMSMIIHHGCAAFRSAKGLPPIKVDIGPGWLSARPIH